jgi:NAD+ synthase (glutamine-hydrolysing)
VSVVLAVRPRLSVTVTVIGMSAVPVSAAVVMVSVVPGLSFVVVFPWHVSLYEATVAPEAFVILLFVSVTAALLRMALDDPARIVGYNLATRYKSDVTKMNAYELAQALGIRLVNGSIERVVEATDAVVASYGYAEGATAGLVQENIQARLRGHMLSTFAAIEGGVIMNNGNKVEAALGYATLYGDAIGAIAPIGDITKVRLFRIARLVNKRLGKAVVPENLIPIETDDGYLWETMPSAELKDAQKDPMKWFYHDWLVENLLDSPEFGVEDLMQAYLEDKLMSSPVAKWIRF